MGHVASAWETQVDRWIAFIGDAGVTMDKLTLGLTSRSAMTILKELASTFQGDPAVQEALVAAGNDEVLFLTKLGASPCGREVRAYLNEYYWMAENDEDMASEHWGDSPSVPLNILMQLLQAPPPMPAAHATAGAAGAVVPTGSTSAPSPSALHSPVPRQSSADEELEQSMADARAIVGDEEGFWRDLRRLRRFLLAKEKIHVCYVKIGFLLKHLLLERSRRWIRTKWFAPTPASFQSYSRSTASSSHAAAGKDAVEKEAVPANAIFSAPVLDLIRALSSDDGTGATTGTDTADGSCGGAALAQSIDIASYERATWRNYKPKYWASAFA